jgi:hypothetical protein
VNPNFGKTNTGNNDSSFDFDSIIERKQNITNIDDLKKLLKDVYIPLESNGKMNNQMYNYYKTSTEEIHKRLIRDQFIIILKMFRDHNNHKFYPDYNPPESNKSDLDPFVNHFYNFGCGFIKDIVYIDYIADIPKFFHSFDTYGKYHEFFINVYSLCMHRIKYYSDNEFLSYECDDETKVGKINTNPGCDGVNFRNHHKELEDKLKRVLEILFGEDINKYIKDSPDILRQDVRTT